MSSAFSEARRLCENCGASIAARQMRRHKRGQACAKRQREKLHPASAKVRFRGETCDVEHHQYQNGRIALELVCSDGEPMAVATTNLPDQPLGDGEVFIKDYSENEGMLAALVAAGIVEDTGRRVTNGFATFPVGRLL